MIGRSGDRVNKGQHASKGQRTSDPGVRTSGLGDEQGSELVEYAVVLVVLLTFLFGIIDFSRFMYTYNFVAGAARDATRYAAVRGSTFTTECSSSSTPYACYALASDIQSYVQSTPPPGITASSVTATTTWPGTAPSGASGACNSTANSTTKQIDNPGCLVEVQVSYPFKFVFPFLPKTTWTVASTSGMVISQ